MPSCCYNPYSSCYRYPSLCRYYVSPYSCCSYAYPCRISSCTRSCCYPTASCCSYSAPCRLSSCSYKWCCSPAASTYYLLDCSYRYPCRLSSCSSRWCCDPVYGCSALPAPVSCSPRYCSGRYPCEDDICSYYPVSALPVRPATSYALSSPAKKRSMSVGRTSRDYLSPSPCRW